MKKDEARVLVMQEWDRWAPKNIPADRKPTGTDGLIFYGYLLQQRRDLLSFRTSGDPWQTVHAWLLRANKVGD